MTTVSTEPAIDLEPADEPLRSITAPRAIALCRRWLAIARVFHAGMTCLLVAAGAWVAARDPDAGIVGGLAVAWLVAFVALVALGVRARRLVVAAVPLIAAGAYDVAEDRLTRSLSSFSVLRWTKLLGLQQLAMLRHAQSRWADAAGLARELLARQQRRGRERALETPARLVLAESLIELGDLIAADREVAALARGPLDLRGTLMLTLFRLELAQRRGDPSSMLAAYPQTLAMVELLPPPLSARAHALMAWAAWRLGQRDRQTFLARRVRLLGDVDAIVGERPALRETLEISPS